MECLYHYTDFQALDGIIRGKQLRLNNILNMNDAAEMRLFMRGLCAAVMGRLRTENELESVKAVKELFDNELEKEFYYSAYAACFSKNRDDAAQWERYGNRGRGVAIAFQKEPLSRMTGELVSLQEVYYQDDMGSHPLVDVFCELARMSSGNMAEVLPVREAMNEAWISSAAFKHPSFASEQEIRLVLSPFSKEFFQVKPCYHVSADRIKKYYPLNLEEMCEQNGCRLEDVVEEIMIGPESTQSKPILQDYLQDHGMGKLAEKVALSDCPLRRNPV